MKKQLFLMVLSGCFLGVFGLFAQGTEVGVQVKLKDTTALLALRAVDSTLILERVFPYSPRFEERHRAHGLHLWYKARVADKARLQELMNRYSALPGIEKVKNVTLFPAPEQEEIIPVVTTAFRSANDVPVNDPLYVKQWHLKNRLYQEGIDINVEKAWELEQGSRDVVVAVMDGGVDERHEDLKDNMWINEAEMNGLPGVDDDGNGYVDDVYGYNFLSDQGESAHANHATHVAGTIAAVKNNALGVSGIAGGDGKHSGVRIMSCQIFADHGNTPDEDIAKAYVYAADNGAVISQNSWAKEAENTDVIADAVNYFIREAGRYPGSPMKGGLVVWAAGNNNTSVPARPETTERIQKEALIIVASVTPTGDKASYSNYGDWVDISAPGGEYNNQGVLSTIADNRYGYNQGTSMACPHVSGIAALVVSKYKGQDLTPVQVKHRVLTAVRDVNRYNEGQTAWQLMGSGIADAWRALLENRGIAPETPKGLYVKRAASSLIELAWPMGGDEDDQAVDSCIVYRSTAPFSDNRVQPERIALYTGGLSAGDTMVYRFAEALQNTTYYFAVQGKDRWGNLSAWSDILSYHTGRRAPVIYGDYLCNHFYTYQNNDTYAYQQDSLRLDYTILAPQEMDIICKLDDPEKAFQMESYENHRVRLLLAPVDQAPGIYQARLIVTDRSDASLNDTLVLTYQVRAALRYPIPAPELRPGKSLELVTKELSGIIKIDLSEYAMDPGGNAIYFVYPRNNDTEYGEFDHALKGTLEGDSLQLVYEFNPEFLIWGEDNRKIGILVHVVNSYGKESTLHFGIVYQGPLSVKNVMEDPVRIYPNPVQDVLHFDLPGEISSVCVYTTDGIPVCRQVTPGRTLDMGTLPSGDYLLQIITSEGTIIRKIQKK